VSDVTTTIENSENDIRKINEDYRKAAGMSWRTKGKQALSLCAGLAMIIGLSACGGSGNSSSSKVAKESSGMDDERC